MKQAGQNAQRIAPATVVGRAGFAAEIRDAWAAARGNVLEAGRQLIAAKAALPHGDFMAMVEQDLPFSHRTATRLMAIAGDPRISDGTHVSNLPASWGTLYELTRIKDAAAFAAAIENGAINPDMERAEARRLATADRRRERLARVERLAAKPPEPLGAFAADRTWPVLYADPAWEHERWSDLGREKSPDNHYPTMPLEEIAALPVPRLAARHAALFLWATVPHLASALEVLRGWGFDYRSHVVWLKTNADGTPHRGTGHWFIGTHELLLLGIRGDMPAPVPGTQAESAIAAPAGRHSEKPERFRRMIEDYFPGVARLELFRRGAAPPGWDVWGNEAGEGDLSAEAPAGSEGG